MNLLIFCVWVGFKILAGAQRLQSVEKWRIGKCVSCLLFYFLKATIWFQNQFVIILFSTDSTQSLESWLIAKTWRVSETCAPGGKVISSWATFHLSGYRHDVCLFSTCCSAQWEPRRDLVSAPDSDTSAWGLVTCNMSRCRRVVNWHLKHTGVRETS